VDPGNRSRVNESLQPARLGRGRVRDFAVNYMRFLAKKDDTLGDTGITSNRTFSRGAPIKGPKCLFF
jgi:hypothetical protein